MAASTPRFFLLHTIEPEAPSSLLPFFFFFSPPFLRARRGADGVFFDTARTDCRQSEQASKHGLPGVPFSFFSSSHRIILVFPFTPWK